MELPCNLKNLKSLFSHENIEKIYFSASFGIMWTHNNIFFDQKIGFKNFDISPIIKSMIFHYNLKKGGHDRIIELKF